MKESRLERLAPLTGVIALVLFSIGAALLGIYEYLPSADRLREIMSDNAANVFAGGYIGSISAFFLICGSQAVFSVPYASGKAALGGCQWWHSEAGWVPVSPWRSDSPPS